MKRPFLILLGGLLFSAGGVNAAPAINFTPWPVDLVMDGFQVREVKFTFGDRSIFYRPPNGWGCTGTQAKASLTTPKYSTLRGEISFLPEKRFNFLPDGRESLREEVRALLPALATEVRLLGELDSPFKVDGQETLFFRFTGDLFADRYQFHLFLIPFEKGTLCFSLYGNEKEIKEAEETFLRSIISWRVE